MISALWWSHNELIACLVAPSIHAGAALQALWYRGLSRHSRDVVCNLTAAPQLTDKPQDVQKTIDDTLVWECKANAKPKPSYRWLKNGEPLDHMEVRDYVKRLLAAKGFWIICTNIYIISEFITVNLDAAFSLFSSPQKQIVVPTAFAHASPCLLGTKFGIRRMRVWLAAGGCLYAFCEGARVTAMILTAECSISICSSQFHR